MADGRGNGGGWRGAAAPAAATVVVIACTALLRFQSTPRLPRPGDLDAGAPGRPYLALVVAQPADCESGTRHLGALNAPALRARVGVAALVIGRPAELERAAEVLRDRFGAVPVRRATRRQLAALRAAGMRATPFIAVLDRGGSLVLTATAPRDEAAAARLQRLLAAVALEPDSTREVSDASG
jgi:hypothetical protein